VPSALEHAERSAGGQGSLEDERRPPATKHVHSSSITRHRGGRFFLEIEVDVYWVSIGGGDPVAAIRAARDRVRMLHMKDRAPDPTSRDVPAGSGVLDFPGIVDAGRAARVHWYIAELDDPVDEIADISAAVVYLESLAG